MLATHFSPVHGNGGFDTLPDFDKNSFDLLLEESLGHDEHGEPNLGTDVGTNHKLISVLFKAGIDRTFNQSKNPFNAYPTGRDALQILLCLDVMRLAVERSPKVLFVATLHSEVRLGKEIPMYAWLIPRLLALLTTVEDEKRSLNAKIRDILAAVLDAGNICSKAISPCSTISAFFHSCSEALLQNVEACGPSSAIHRNDYLGSEQEAFTRALSKLHIEKDFEHADMPIQIPGASLAALTMTACSVVALVDSPDGAMPKRMRIASQSLDHLERIWSILADNLEDAESGVHGLLIAFFDTMQRLRPATAEATLMTCRQRCTLLWAASFSDCMDAIHSLMDDSSQEALRIMLKSALDVAMYDIAYCKTLSEILDSRLQVIRDEGQLNSELQVSELLTGHESYLTMGEGIGLGSYRSHAEATHAN